jgi:hypothetical protein
VHVSDKFEAQMASFTENTTRRLAEKRKTCGRKKKVNRNFSFSHEKRAFANALLMTTQCYGSHTIKQFSKNGVRSSGWEIIEEKKNFRGCKASGREEAI